MNQVTKQPISLRMPLICIAVLVLFNLSFIYSKGYLTNLHLRFLPLASSITDKSCAFPLGDEQGCTSPLANEELSQIEAFSRQVAAQSGSNSVQVHEFLGSLHLLATNYEVAEQFISLTVENNPSDFRKLLLAAAYDGQGKRDEVIALLDDNIFNSQAVLEAGFVEYRWGDRDIAFERLSLFQRLEPDQASGALAYMGTILKDEGRWDEAAELYLTALEVDAGWHRRNQRLNTPLNYARVLREVAKLDGATGAVEEKVANLEIGLEALNKLELFMGSPTSDLLFLKGQIHLDLEQTSEASTIFEQMMFLFPKDPRGFLYYGIVIYASSPIEGIRLMTTAVSLDETNQSKRIACTYLENQADSEGVVNFNQQLSIERHASTC